MLLRRAGSTAKRRRFEVAAANGVFVEALAWIRRGGPQSKGVLGEATRRMLKLDPLIAGFIHDVLHALRGATLDELSDLFSLPKAPARAARVVAARVVAPRPVVPAALAPRAPRVKKESPRRPQRAARVRVAAPTPTVRARVLKSTVKSLAQSIVADITDPEWLLAATTHVAPPKADVDAVVPEEDVPPASGERLARVVTAALRAGETLVRSSGSGVVIRRAKRV